MERRTGEVVSEIPLDELVIGNRYTITYIDDMYLRMGGDRIKTFRGTLFHSFVFPYRLDGVGLERAGDRMFRFVDIRDLSSGLYVQDPLTLHEGRIVRVEKYNIAPYGISDLSKKINQYIGGLKKRRKTRRKTRRKKRRKKKHRKKRTRRRR